MEKTAIQAGPPPAAARPAPREDVDVARRRAPKPLWREVLEPLASLRLTVVLFALSMVIVFYGTWAQKEMGIWQAVNTYFRSWFVMIPIRVILFQTIESNPFSIPFPGGWTLGALLFTNLLAAHALRFKLSWKRSGIFILHAGVIVMMLAEFITGMWAIEGMMQIVEGDRTNYKQHLMDPELAVIDTADPKIDDTVVVPHRILRAGPVSDERLPFDIELLEYYPNADDKVALDPKKRNLATAGLGTLRTVKKMPEVSGTDPDQKFDTPAAFVKLTDKSGQHLGTYLVHYFWPGQHVKVGDKNYEITLRPKRTYYDFTVYLDKADFKVYPGTGIPKDYSSYVRILDKKGTEIRKTRIFMNNPMYFNDETYFQSGMTTRAPLVSTLQVVYDPGKLMPMGVPMGLPLLSCIMVAIGMMIHFGINLISFLERRMGT